MSPPMMDEAAPHVSAGIMFSFFCLVPVLKTCHNYFLSIVQYVKSSFDTIGEPDAPPPQFPCCRNSPLSDRPAELKPGRRGCSRLTPHADRCGYNTSLPDCKAVKLAAVQQTQHLHLSALTS